MTRLKIHLSKYVLGKDTKGWSNVHADASLYHQQAFESISTGNNQNIKQNKSGIGSVEEELIKLTKKLNCTNRDDRTRCTRCSLCNSD